jgi:phospholipid/cholesterol/gamma-HCH transport system permease protein
MAEAGAITVERSGDQTLVVHLRGNWLLENGLPPVDPVQRELSRSPVRTVVFDAAGLSDWDSALVSLLEKVRELAKQSGASVDASGLPPGAQRLLRLAEAVPEKAGVRRAEDERGLVARVGMAVTATLAGAREMLAFLGEVTLSFARFAIGRARVRAQDLLLLLQQCGAEALPIVTLISVLVGMILAFVGAVQLQRFGAEIYVADLVVIAMTREMGCIMTAIIMAGRTGSGFAAELGTMKVTQEIDAFTTLGISPMDFLVLPRIIALVLMMPLLTIFSDVLGILGGALVSAGMLDLSVFQYWNEGQKSLTFANCTIGVGKSVVFGALVALAGCLRGMQGGRSSAAVGEAATSAVVTGIVLIIAADGLFAVIFNILDV